MIPAARARPYLFSRIRISVVDRPRTLSSIRCRASIAARPEGSARVTDLAKFLKAQLGPAGDWNCSTLAADWCIALDYPDFAAKWRTIVDPAECEAVTRAAGGLVPLWREGIGDRLALADGSEEKGDIAVVSLDDLEAGAIFTGERWVLRLPHGLVFASPFQVNVVRAWRP